MSGTNDNKQRRKRSANTSIEQIEEYLKFMECDEIFRTNTLKPTVAPDYIEKIWDKLAKKLNSCDSGPVLSSKEWTKRFNDWKNNTRAKYRKVVESRIKTGGGEGENVKLSNQEDRGLAVWGKVSVTGSCKVPVVGGLQLHLNPRMEMDTELTPLPSPESPLREPTDVLRFEINETMRALEVEKEMEVNQGDSQEEKSQLHRQKKNKKTLCKRPKENRTIKTIGEELLSEYKKNDQSENHVKLAEKQLKLEVAKFKFEVAKYKFENSSFSFDPNLSF